MLWRCTWAECRKSQRLRLKRLKTKTKKPRSQTPDPRPKTSSKDQEQGQQQHQRPHQVLKRANQELKQKKNALQQQEKQAIDLSSTSFCLPIHLFVHLPKIHRVAPLCTKVAHHFVQRGATDSTPKNNTNTLTPRLKRWLNQSLYTVFSLYI